MRLLGTGSTDGSATGAGTAASAARSGRRRHRSPALRRIVSHMRRVGHWRGMLGVGVDGQLGASPASTDVECGPGQQVACTRPAPVAAICVRDTGAGEFTTCGVTTAGRAYCWGRTRSVSSARSDRHTRSVRIWRGLVTAVPPCSLVPTAVAGRSRSSRVAISLLRAAPSLNGAAYCWGSDGFSRLGVGRERSAEGWSGSSERRTRVQGRLYESDVLMRHPVDRRRVLLG
jgi:hypothetical protein